MIEGRASGQKTPKLRYGMVGGGQGAFIGDVHRKSIAMDGKAEVVCENPLATSARDATDLACLVRETGLLFCVTYAYSGYPMVKHLRDLIARGEIGEIRFVNGEFPHEWLGA